MTRSGNGSPDGWGGSGAGESRDPGAEDLLSLYRRSPRAGRDRLPWSFATLSPGQRHDLAARLDRFAVTYNRRWALDGAVVPPCWYRHPALADDLAALAWTHHAAYRDPAASPDLALRFQEGLPRFAARLEGWLAPDPAACRAGEHPDEHRDHREVPVPEARRTQEQRDAVLVLGELG